MLFEESDSFCKFSHVSKKKKLKEKKNRKRYPLNLALPGIREKEPVPSFSALRYVTPKKMTKQIKHFNFN